MIFSVIIPTYNNLDYLKLCIKSLKKNSKYNHELIFHINEGIDGSLNYIKSNNYKFSYSSKNQGVCYAYNEAVNLAVNKYIVLGHDDMYFCPGWDVEFLNEIKKIDAEHFFISGTMVEPFKGLNNINFNCGTNINNFNEDKLNENLPKIFFDDFQGTHWQPSLIPIKTWNIAGGFSMDFSPGLGSDPDFNMKLWNLGVRIFKGLGKCRVYHFSSLSLRKKVWNNGAKIFLLKWGISIKFFKKYFLKSGEKFNGPLEEPKKNFTYFIDLFVCKAKLLYLYLISPFDNYFNNR